MGTIQRLIGVDRTAKCCLLLGLVALAPLAPAQTSPWERDVIYQIFPRSFRDSDGDRIGDLKGIASKLGYIQKVGATAILINPVFEARVYHNYFADDFFRVDPEFGTNQDFFHLVRQAHQRGIKVILDMEVQYVTEKHPWSIAADRSAAAKENAYLWREGSAFYNLAMPWYDRAKVRAAAVHLSHPAVLDYMKRTFRFWAAPNGKPKDGVDGFRIDHMMDDLDNKHVETDLLRRFWLPIERDVRKVKPGVFFVGEQADWTSVGKDIFAKTATDAVYGIGLRFVIAEQKAAKVSEVLGMMEKATPKGRTNLVFIEGHDVERFATAADGDEALQRLGAVLNLTLKGIPTIYYGQEIGMRGKQGNWKSDGNDIPIRLAFRWNRKLDAKGTATWYRGTGPWWSLDFSRDADGVSVEEQTGRPASLLEFYRRLIALRKRDPALREGTQKVVATGNESVFAFVRTFGRRRVLVAVNFAKSPQSFTLPWRDARLGKDLVTGRHAPNGLTLAARGYAVVELR